jgi:hypothetical protein
VVAGLIKSAGFILVIRVLGRQAQKWARVTRNKTVRAVRPKADNIWQVGPGCYIWLILGLVIHLYYVELWNDCMWCLTSCE